MSDTPDRYGPDDPWEMTRSAHPLQHGAVDAYAVTTLDGITPLEAQLGVVTPQTVPDERMAEVLLGGAAQWLTYAILDGAKIDGLAERLETAELPHACLFANSDDLGAVAPWLVQLDRDTPLVRQLFTAGEGPRALWGADAGVFLRSALPLADLRAHLRRFTKVRADAEAAPVFFRFWEPRVMARYVQAHDPAARASLCALLGTGAMIAVDRHNDRAVHVVADSPAERPPRVWPRLHADLSPIRLEIFVEDLADRIAVDIPPLADVARAERRETVTGLVQAARGIALRLDKSVTRYVYAALMIGGLPEADPRFADIVGSGRHELDRSRLMLKLARDV